MRTTTTLVMLILLCCSVSTASAATFNVRLRNFEFIPNDLTINVGDTVVFTNSGGTHNVVADDFSFGNSPSSQAWTFSHTFTAAGVVGVYCSIHSQPGVDPGSGMNARINVLGDEPPPPTFSINQGISGAWFNPSSSGQGFLIDVEPESAFFFSAWFTFDTVAASKLGVPEHRWLSLQGSYQGGQAEVPIFLTRGGVFDRPDPTTTTSVGTATVEFESCTAGSVSYEFTDPPLSGTIPIQRVIPGTEALCEQIDAASQASGHN